MREREAARARLPPRLADVFNVQGSELIFLLLIALVVLGPEKLPEAVRKFTKAYSEFKKMANGFQGEFRQVLDEPMRELRETANLVRDAAKFDLDIDPDPDGKGISAASTTAPRDKKTDTTDSPAGPATVTTSGPGQTSAVSEIAPKPAGARRQQNLNFGSANPRRQTRIARDDASVAAPAAEAAPTPDAAPTSESAPADAAPAPTAEDATG